MKKIKNIILLLLIIIFIFSISKIILFYVDLYKNQKNNNKLLEKVINVEIEEETQEEIFQIDFEELSSINNDTIGWIRYNNDKINYPIVHTNNNSYYLTHSFDKNYNQAGAIFMDYRNTLLEDKNVVLFGHAMLDGTMFGSIEQLFEEKFFEKEENNYIQIYNKNNELITYQIFSYYIIEKEEYYITTTFNNDNEFYNYINTMLSRSYKNFNVDVTTNDKILTLSTCHGIGNTTKRKVVHAKRISNLNEEI